MYKFLYFVSLHHVYVEGEMVLMSYYKHSLLFRCYYPNNLLLSLAMQIKVIGTQAISSIQVRYHLAFHGYNINVALYIYSYSELVDINNHILTIIPTNWNSKYFFGRSYLCYVHNDGFVRFHVVVKHPVYYPHYVLE